MKALRIVIADDEEPARRALRRALSLLDGVEVVGEATNGLELLDLAASTQPDLAFVDIQMPGLDGLEVASRMATKGGPAVVFVTAHSGHALEAFEREALDYIVKPVRPERVAASIERVRRLGAPRLSETEFASGTGPASLPRRQVFVRSGGSLQPVDFEAVQLAEAAGNYVRVQIGEASLLLRTGMNEIVEQCAGRLVRLHRSFAARPEDVVELFRRPGADPSARLRSGRVIPVGRTYWAALRSRLGG